MYILFNSMSSFKNFSKLKINANFPQKQSWEKEIKFFSDLKGVKGENSEIDGVSNLHPKLI